MSSSSESDLIARTVEECKTAHQSDTYFEGAEPWMQQQWDWFVWPNIKGADFSRLLELAPGYGRNTARLLGFANEIHMVDVNESCIQRCRDRFAKYSGPCRLFYYVNDGKSLSMLPSNHFTFVYSWDAMVHFDRLVVREYLREFGRVMAPGATGFVHHSNYGMVSDSADWQKNPAWRSNMTKDLFVEYAEQAGLKVTKQELLAWEGIKDLDCMSNFRKA
jgi:SAM-dependent methyltransferase